MKPFQQRSTAEAEVEVENSTIPSCGVKADPIDVNLIPGGSPESRPNITNPAVEKDCDVQKAASPASRKSIDQPLFVADMPQLRILIFEVRVNPQASLSVFLFLFEPYR
jgi:hypothetical protein